MNFIKHVLKNIYLVLRKIVLRLIPTPKIVEELNPSLVTSIVAIRIDRIGDVVVSLPAIRALRDIFPNSRLAVILRPENIPLLKNISWIDELIPYHGFVNSVKMLRKRHFYMIIDLLMDYTIKTAIISFFSGANRKVGFDIEERGRFFNLALKPGPEKRKMSKHILELVKSVGRISHIDEGNIQESEPRLFVSRKDNFFANEFFKNLGVKGDDIIFGLHPGGRFPSQFWMLESFAKLVERVSEKYKAKIIIVGSYKEERLIKKLISSMNIKPLLAIGFSLDKLASIIAKTSVFICNNSGPLHIAAALGIPTVSTMGPTDPYLWWPHGKNQIVIRHPLPCSPCNLGFCRSHKCMRLITVEEMEKAVDIQMQRIGKRA